MFQKQFESGVQVISQSGIKPWADRGGYVVIAPLAGGNHDKRRLGLALVRTNADAYIDLERIYAIGSGIEASKFVRELPCSMKLAGAATLAAGMTPNTGKCRTPVPMLRLVGLKNKYVPVNGGAGCLGGKYLSLSDTERYWQSRNSCDAPRRVWAKHNGQTCHTWDCETRLASCHMSGGSN